MREQMIWRVKLTFLGHDLHDLQFEMEDDEHSSQRQATAQFQVKRINDCCLIVYTTCVYQISIRGNGDYFKNKRFPLVSWN